MLTTGSDAFHPQLSYIFAQDAEEQEDKEALEGIEEHKKDLESERAIFNCKSSKDPRQAEEEHYTRDADEKSDGSCSTIHLVLQTNGCVLGLSDENSYHHDKHDNVEEEDSKDGTQECPKEHSNFTDEATAERERSGTSIHSSKTLGILL